MEDPIDFDIWCKIKNDSLKDAAKWKTAMYPFLRFIDAYKTVADSVALDGYTQLFVNCGWNDIPSHLEALPGFVQADSAVVTESSYRPSACGGYCDKHLVRYVAAACPVCSGNYISHILNGKKFVCPVSTTDTRV